MDTITKDAEVTGIKPDKDSVIVVHVTSPKDYSDLERISSDMVSAFPGQLIIILPDGVTLESLTPEQLREFGLTRLQ